MNKQRDSKGHFIKGHNTPLLESTKMKISESCKKSGVGKWMKDRKMSEESKQKNRIHSARYWLGKKRGKQSKELIERRIAPLRGRKRPEISEMMKGNTRGFKKGHNFGHRFKKGEPSWNKGLHIPLIKRRREHFGDKKYRDWVKQKHARVIKRLKNEGKSHTFDEWEELKKKYNYTCPCCGKSEPEIKLTEDHIIPLSKCGSDLIENIQPLCLTCNLKKHTKIIKYELK